ncbi:hypothetical protein O988_05327 [Pseudogymnoascus sp. VKM F-3808]|nr:hypothetical protein O988_05327 [Pseudogymnoascus sp. VKM F-3808]
MSAIDKAHLSAISPAFAPWVAAPSLVPAPIAKNTAESFSVRLSSGIPRSRGPGAVTVGRLEPEKTHKSLTHQFRACGHTIHDAFKKQSWTFYAKYITVFTSMGFITILQLLGPFAPGPNAYRQEEAVEEAVDVGLTLCNL